jgi:hypothetical protein
VYLVFSTIKPRTQHLQVACFRNAASHLRPGGGSWSKRGYQLDRLAAGESICPERLP